MKAIVDGQVVNIGDRVCFKCDIEQSGVLIGVKKTYAEYIMEHSAGDRIICNGDTLLDAMEDGYLFDDYLLSLGLTLP